MFQQFAKDTNICKQLLPFILELLNQTENGNGNIEIKIAYLFILLSIESALIAATKYIQFTGVEALSQMMMHYKTAITSEKWQMRYAVLEQLVELAIHFNVLSISQLVIIFRVWRYSQSTWTRFSLLTLETK